MIPCPFISAGHPFEPAMDRIREALEHRPQSMRSAGCAVRTAHQHELKGVQDATGSWRLDRFYASTHAWHDAREVPFEAVTYHYSDATGAGEWFRFPREPYLDALAHLTGARYPEVLQYVVLRRLTFRARHDDGTRYIGKFKRRARARSAYDVLVLISSAARRHQLSFRIPDPAGYDETRHLFHQDALPGRPVSDLIDASRLEGLMFGVGCLLAELHALPVDGLPAASERTRLELLTRNCAWIAFFRAHEGARLRAVKDALLAIAPRLSTARPVTCHGDFVCSHVLHGLEGWAVVDFDAAHRGDAHADAAWLLASLTEDVPLLHRAWRDPNADAAALVDGAVAAFIEGYQSLAARQLNRRALLWHRIATEIHLLGLMFTKDRFHDVAFDRSVALIDRLADELSRARAGAA